MALTVDEAIMALRADEPNYAALAQRLGADSGPALTTLAASDDVEIASKTASLAPFLDSDTATQILRVAVTHADPIVRVAAAASVHVLPPDALQPARLLLDDADVGVRHWALRSMERSRPAALKDQVSRIAESDSDPGLRVLADRLRHQL